MGGNRRNHKLTPYSVDIGEEKLGKNWNNYLVLLMNDRGENKLVKVCFTKNLMDNFGIVMSTEKHCKKKIELIKKHKILEDEESQEQNNQNNNKEKESDQENKEVSRISKKHKMKHRSKKNLKKLKYKRIIESFEKKSKNVNDEISLTENEIKKLKENEDKKT